MDYTTHPKSLVLMSRVEFGLLGHYNKYKKSPFETFDVGGDGMTGYSSYATESIALRGYENSSLTPYGSEGYAYTRLGIELRYPLMLETSTNIYVLGFLEAGNAWNDINKFNPFDLKRSAGVGVRIFLPMIGMMGSTGLTVSIKYSVAAVPVAVISTSYWVKNSNCFIKKLNIMRKSVLFIMMLFAVSLTARHRNLL